MALFRWIWRSPKSENEWGRFVGSFFHKSLLMLFVMMLLLFASMFLIPDADYSRLPTLLSLLLLNIISFGLLQFHSLRFALHFFVWSTWLVVAAGSISSIGVYTPGYLVSVMLILMAGMGLSQRSTLILTSSVVAFGLPLLYAHTQGWIPSPTNHNLTPVGMWITTSALYLVVAYVMIKVRETTFAIAAHHQRDEAFYRAIVEDQTEFIVRWKVGGIRTFANSAYLRYFGITLDQAIGTNFFPHINEDDRNWVNNKIIKLSPENPIDIGEHRVIRPDGTQGWQEWSDRAIFDENNNIIEYQSVGRDITAIKELENRQHELELAQEQEKFLRDFLSTMSHDLQTPLSVMRTNLYMLKKSPDKPQERIEKIDRQIEKLSGMIEDILTVARLEHSPELERRPIDLALLLENSLTPLRDEAKAKNIDLASPEPLPSAVLKADLQELQRALSNLISNAIKYTPQGGQVRVEARTQTDILQIIIIDTGIGIDSEDLPRIFERFYRAKNAKDFEKGTGLGLAIVKRIIELHDGTISVSSSIGAGSSFSIQLPLYKEPVLA